jgi:hypothetical protein
MPTPVNIENHVTNDIFTLTMWQEIQSDLNYLLQRGTAASAASVSVTNQIMEITGTTNIDNLTNGVLAGQLVTLEFAAVCTVRHNGGGTGNIRLTTGFNYTSYVGACITFYWTGSVWREVSRSGGAEMTYDSITANASISTSYSSVIAGTSKAYDASNKRIEFYSDGWGNTQNNTITFQMRAGTTVLREMSFYLDNGVGSRSPIYIVHKDRAPAAATFAYNVQAKVDVGSGTVLGGAGGAGANGPAFICVTQE